MGNVWNSTAEGNGSGGFGDGSKSLQPPPHTNGHTHTLVTKTSELKAPSGCSSYILVPPSLPVSSSPQSTSPLKVQNSKMPETVPGELKYSCSHDAEEGPPGGLLFTVSAHSTNKLQKITTTITRQAQKQLTVPPDVA